MTIFLRLMAEADKAGALASTCDSIRMDEVDGRVFQVEPSSFRAVPGAPFAYWVNDRIRNAFQHFPQFESDVRIVRQGGVTGNDDRYLRLWWETQENHKSHLRWQWVPFAKGGAVSRWHSEFPVRVIWDFARGTFGGFTGLMHRPSEKPSSADHYFRGGLTWPLRAAHFAPVPLPRGAVFSIRGYAVLSDEDDLLTVAAICNSRIFDYIFKVSLGRFGFPEFVVGILQQLPLPEISLHRAQQLKCRMARAWSLKRTLAAVAETSHAFLLPVALSARIGDYDPAAIEAELTRIQAEIDFIAFELYGLAEADLAALPTAGAADAEETEEEDEADDEAAAPVDSTASLLSWAVGVAFGRFDIRLATGERDAPPEPEPFDPLPAKSPGMLPDDAAPFHAHTGILVDDVGHRHDLSDLVARVLDRVGQEVQTEIGPWLRREFFPLHLRQYSKSRRKAPIYWPLSTASGSYTLWLYYPALTDQTLYSAANDFVGIKLDEQVVPALRDLRQKTGRSREEEGQLEALQTLHDELRDLRDELLRLARFWRPHHDDGVQISAAPLWRLFRHRPWQTVLRDTWDKLEAGDYDWSHLAMTCWPDRVQAKCRTDRSLAIAHDLEHLYEPPPEAAVAKAGRGRKKKG